MKKNTILTLILLVMPLMATAQDAEVPPVQVDSAWVFSSVLPEGGIPVDSALANASGMHGVAVDGDGKIWLQPFATTETIVLDGVGGDPVATRALYIYNPDGTEADFSPLTTFEYVDGSDVDTVGHYWHSHGRDEAGWEGMSGRGLKADDDGNIIVSTGGVIYRIRKDGKGMNKFPYLGADGRMDSPTAAAVDGQGNVYIAPVVPGANSLIKLPKDFSPSTTPEVLLAETPGFSRAFEVSDDGNTIYWNGYSNGAVYVYSRTDEFSPFDPMTYTEMTGLASESATFNPVTGHIWLSGGSTFSPASNGYANQTWYGFDPSDLSTPLESITWNGDAMDNSEIGAGEGRPRGLGFSLDGGTAYVVQFNEAILAAQTFSGKVRAPRVVANQWAFDGVLPEGGIPVDSALANASGMHGVAVDGDGKIWLQPFATTETIVLDGVGGDPVATRALYIYNPDGTEADFSPLTTFEYVDGSDVDTVGHYWHSHGRDEAGWEGMSGRGLKADDDGNIIVSTGGVIYRIRKDGKGMNKFPYLGADGRMDSPTAAAVDGQGNVYIAPVVPGANSLIKLPKDFSPSTTPEVLLAETPGFSRAFEVSDDGNTIYWNGYSNGAVYVYSRTDEFSPFDPMTYTEMTGLASESATFNPVTGHIWLSGGSTFSPASNGYANQTWYAFDPSDLDTPLASITWNGDAMDNSAIGAGEGRPRGLAFSPDGGTAYVVQFNEAILAAQRFMGDASTSIEGEDEVNTTPQNFRLDQNYPNPFNPSTNIEFELPAAANTMLQVYDVSGRLVATLVNGNMPAGVHTVTFNASDLSSGVYFYMLRSGNLSVTKQMTLIK